MIYILKNEKGAVGALLMALVAVIMTISATVAFTNIVQMDTNEVQYLQDKLQQELFLRSEIKRINILLENNALILPTRTIEMVNSDRIATYKIKLKESRVTITNNLGLPMEEASAVQALITQKRGRAILANAETSPVARFITKLSNRKNLSNYAYFSDNEASDLYESGPQARVKFYGFDELTGPVHSNSDIWIQSGGGGNANPDARGWPLFRGLVTTAGVFMHHDTEQPLIGSGFPDDNVFQGPDPRRIEHVASIPYIGTADLIRKNGSGYFGLPTAGNSNNKIYKCQITGRSIDVTILDCSQTHTDTFVVYKSYPDALHPLNPNDTAQKKNWVLDSLYTNTITIRDTVPGNTQNYPLVDKSMFIPGETWIEGIVYGKMTVGSAKDIYTTGNITYLNTPVGNLPITSNSINTTDYFGLVSEGKIILKYKYREYDGSKYITHANNSQGPNGHVWLYGSYAALGVEPNVPFGFLLAGTLTYEYQHPHGAVMPYRGYSQFTGADTLYTFIDLHRHRYPPADPSQTNRPLWNRWPNQTPQSTSNGFPNDNIANYDYTQNSGSLLYKTSDYPWYNPVWPEKDAGPEPGNLATDITWERGTLHIYGSIAQRRRGFIHRSGTGASNNNPDTGIWDPSMYTANGTLKMPIYGPPHRSTGYEKDYKYDERLSFVHPPDFPEVYKGGLAGMQSAFDDAAWNFSVPPKGF
ncbi:MAG TPA: hypothetical protein PL063_02370 [Candidatus Cloacimonadota bacterium]|nr:hypothetical protein [Candidatus Cloacimonadales bacterium]HPY96040.1 hypothetical protein [Candidatus Cloacimonadota bacterium]HQB40573.1 hypothetical protein [Candidatus Cloacimonadota bacterium]